MTLSRRNFMKVGATLATAPVFSMASAKQIVETAHRKTGPSGILMAPVSDEIAPGFKVHPSKPICSQGSQVSDSRRLQKGRLEPHTLLHRSRNTETN